MSVTVSGRVFKGVQGLWFRLVLCVFYFRLFLLKSILSR